MKLYKFNRRNSLILLFLSISLVILTHLHTIAQSPKVWQYISTQHYDIYFLQNMGHEAQRLANALEGLYIPINKSLHTQPTRRAVVLLSEATISNGATPPPLPLPFGKIRIYAYPPQRHELIANNEWLNALAVHELRHVAQFSSLIKNYSFVPPMWTAGNFFTPSWLFEGDAVGMETALTTGGRGRTPNFTLLYKVNLLERGGFSYYKNLCRSYKNNIPDHYRLGYLLTTHLRRQYGPDIIRNIFERKGFMDFINPWAIEYKVKKFTGKNIKRIFADANQELKELWTNQLKDLPITPFHPINKRRSQEYIDYYHPHPTPDGGTIVLVSSLSNRPYFAYLDEQGKEKFLVHALISQGEGNVRFSIANHTIYWIEGCLPQIWEKTQDIQYTTIRSYDWKNKIYSSVVPTGRNNLVAASPDGSKLATVETNTAYQHHIAILEAETGDVIQRIENPDNHYYLTPSWSPDGKQLVSIKQTKNKSVLTLIEVKTGNQTDVLPPSQEIIYKPIIHPPYIYYGSAYSGIDNIYAIHIDTKQRFQVTSSKYGAYNPAITTDGKWLLYNDFGKYGMEAVKIPLDPETWIPLNEIEDRSIHYYEPLVAQEDNPNILEQLPQQTYPVHPFNPDKKFGIKVEKFSLIVRNFSNTLIWKAISLQKSIFLPNRSNNLNLLHQLYPIVSTKLTYQGWYPVISLESVFSNFFNKKEEEEGIENTNYVSLKLPFTWSDRGYAYEPLLKTSNITHISSTKWSMAQSYTFQMTRALPKSLRDLYHPWLQQISITYLHPLYSYGEEFTNRIRPSLLLYFPGLFSNHSLRLNYTPTYYRAYKQITAIQRNKNNHKIRKMKAFTVKKSVFQTASISYTFPLYYPDIELINLFYLKALWLDLDYNLRYSPKGPKKLNYMHSGTINVIANLNCVNLWLGIKINSDKDFSFVRNITPE